MTNPTPQGGEPLWSNKQLALEAEGIVVGKYGVVAVYDVLKMVRDGSTKELQAKLAQQAARLDFLERKVRELTGESLE